MLSLLLSLLEDDTNPRCGASATKATTFVVNNIGIIKMPKYFRLFFRW